MDRQITITHEPKVYRALLLRTWSRHTTLPWRVAYFVISELPIALGIYSGNASTLYWAFAGGIAVSGFWPLLLIWREMRAYNRIFGNRPGYAVNIRDESLTLDTGTTRFEMPWFSLTEIVKCYDLTDYSYSPTGGSIETKRWDGSKYVRSKCQEFDINDDGKARNYRPCSY